MCTVDWSGGRPANILLVEDNLADVELTREGFERARLSIHLQHVENGRECLELLRKQGRYADAPTPDLILLDLNMPIMDGREVLAELIRDERLRQIPVVVLTTSADEADVLSTYRLKCSSYATKPVDFHQFLAMIQGIANFYFALCVLPPNRN